MMKRAAILGAIVVGGLVAATLAAQGRPRIPPVGGIQKVRDNLYKIGGAGGNTTVFVTDRGVVLVDTKLPGNGQAILDQVRTVTDKPVTMLINTHSHPDHNGSNDFFRAAMPTIDIVAQDNVKHWVAANPKSDPAMMPTRTFATTTTLGGGKDRIDLYYFGAGHTNGDALVVFPAVRAMCIGDLMAWNMAPLIDPTAGGSVLALPDTLDKAARGIRNVDLVIEGHGNVNTWAGFRLMARFDRALVAAARAALAKDGYTETGVANAVATLGREPSFAPFLGEALLPGLEYGNTPKARAAMNVRVAFQELRHQPVTTNFGGTLPPAPAN